MSVVRRPGLLDDLRAVAQRDFGVFDRGREGDALTTDHHAGPHRGSSPWVVPAVDAMRVVGHEPY